MGDLDAEPEILPDDVEADDDLDLLPLLFGLTSICCSGISGFSLISIGISTSFSEELL